MYCIILLSGHYDPLTSVADRKCRRYDFLDSQKQSAQAAKAANPDPEAQFEAALKLRADGLNMESKLPWIYMNDIESVWDQYVAERKKG